MSNINSFQINKTDEWLLTSLGHKWNNFIYVGTMVYTNTEMTNLKENLKR